MKKNRCGKAAIFSPNEITKIRKAFSVPQHRAIFEIALYTGERMGAICQLKVDDVYRSPSILHEVITFPARTRKARPNGKRESRQVAIHADLKSFLLSYSAPNEGYLFPGRGGSNSHITYDSVYQYWQHKFLKLGLDHRGFSTHSPRRWFITNLVSNGIDVKTLQQITGHKSTSVLLGYVEENFYAARRAIATLKIET